MPDVEGKLVDEAKAQLEALDLLVRVVIVPENEGSIVADQNPEPGETVQQGQQVTLYAAD
jgi:beta-lactam-binding protein with PASTA domain